MNRIKNRIKKDISLFNTCRNWFSSVNFSGKLLMIASLFGAAAWLTVSFRPLVPEEGDKSERPDILLFIADDMTSRDCEPYGNPDVNTPNLAKLAKEGICFDNMYNAAPICCPTRQSLYTGIFPVKNGAWPNHSRVYDNITSVAHHFRNIGYRVALIGKQHYAPASSFPFEYLGGRNSDNGEGQDINLGDAESYINKDRSKPWLLIVATNQPHGPWNRGNPAQYDPSRLTIAPYMVDTRYTREQLTKYYAEITYADSLVGDCMKMVDRHGNKENTLFIFTSEHGASFPFGKWTCYNMGLKAAFIARWPRVIKPSTRTDMLSQYVDVVPTLYEAAGQDPEKLRGNTTQTMKLDGKSFYRTLKGEPIEIRDYVYGVQTTRGVSSGSLNYPVRSVQNRNYKLIWNLNYKKPFYNAISKPENQGIKGNRIYMDWLNNSTDNPKEHEHVNLYQNRPEFELFDVNKDPYELNNLSGQSAELANIQEQLFIDLKKWMKQQGDEGIETEMKALRRFKGDTLKWKSAMGKTLSPDLPLVRINEDGSLSYRADEKGNTIPDFSRVGYHQGDKSIPVIKVVKTVFPASEGSSQQLIQEAIDEVSSYKPDKNGFRGAVLLKKGTYVIPGTLKITTGGIVLRGEGDNAGGTKLVAGGKVNRTLLSITGSGSIQETPGSRTDVTDSYVPAGQFFLNVEKPERFKAGDPVVIYRPGTDTWIKDLQMDKIVPREGTRQWRAEDYNLSFERRVVDIKGTRLYIDQPVVMPIEKKYGGAEVFKYTLDGRISEVGVENILFESEYLTETDEAHAWNAIDMEKVEHAWVKQVTSCFFGNSCVNIMRDARYITVMQSRCLDPKSIITGRRRYSFAVNGQFNLVRDCESREGRHDYVTRARTLGPNVFYNCKASGTHSDIGPHERWSAGTLYDNIITDGDINIQDRGNHGTGHGWTGTAQVLWNCTVRKAAVQSPWVSGKNYAIGVKGEKYAGRLKGRPDGAWERAGQSVNPTSLYLAQLRERHRKKE